MHPLRDIGTSAAVAHHAVGARADRPLSPAHGFAAVDPRGAPHMLRAASLPAARREALRWGAPATLCRAVGRGTVTLWERVERLTADPVPGSQPCTPAGTLRVEKRSALAPELIDSSAFARQLAGALRAVDEQALTPALTQYLGRLDRDWATMSHAARVAALDDAAAWLRTHAVLPALPRWEGAVQTTITTVAGETRRALRERFIPRLGLSFRREETAALARIGTQQGWFLRDRYGAISQELTARGRQIVADGLREGWGRNEIGRQLRDQLPALWQGRGRQYANVLAANAVSRGRSHAELSSYRDASIEYMEVQAILDERTTDQCRFLDGTIISVADAYGVSEAAANVSRPEDIYNTSPFVNPVWTDADGRRLRRGDEGRRDHRELQTTTGTRLAIIDRSGVGRKDDPGQFRGLIGGNHLHDAHLGPPPYHHACRSYTVPRMDIHSVPQGYAAVATDGPLLPPGSAAPGLRPVEYHREPTLRNPLRVGSPAPLDSLLLPAQVLERLVFPPARERGMWAAVRAVVPHPDAPTMVLQRAAAHPASRDDLAALTAHRPSHLFDGLGGHADGMLLVGARTPLTPEQLVGLATHPAAAGRDLVVRVGIRARQREQWLRVVQAQAPRGALQAAARAVTTGRWTAAEYEAWLAAAQRDGWLRLGTKLDDVMLPPALRGGVVPPPPVPPVITPPVPVAGYTPTRAVIGGLRDVAVPTEIYTARPSPDMIRKAIQRDQPQGYVRFGTVAEKPLPTLGQWRGVDVSAANRLNQVTELTEITDATTLVHLWNPYELGSADIKRMYSQIISAELDRGFAGVREYVIQDIRGVSWFVRFDGAAAARVPRMAINAAQQNLFTGGVEAEQALTYLRAHVADSTATLAQFYPEAVVDWSVPGLLSGVPLREQALRRTAAVRAEIEVSAQQYISAGMSSDTAMARAIGDALNRDRAPSLGSKGMAVRGEADAVAHTQLSDVVRQAHVRTDSELLTARYAQVSLSEYKNVLDLSLYPASPALREATTQIPAPYILRGEVERSYYKYAPGAGEPPVLVLGKFGQNSSAVHEYTHHLERIGLTGPAARIVRNQRIVDGRLIDIFGDRKELALPGPYTDTYAAKLYGPELEHMRSRKSIDLSFKSQTMIRELDQVVQKSVWNAELGAGEYLTTAAEDVMFSLRPWADDPVYSVMEKIWRIDPDQVSVYIAAQRGAFVPQ